MRKLLSDGTGAPVPGTPAPVGARPPLSGSKLVIPILLVAALLVGVAIVAYSFGVSRGKGNANSERDIFYIQRASSWAATATAQAGGAPPNPTVVAASGFTLGSATFGRIDKIEGDKVSVLLLNGSAAPTGTTLIVQITRQTQVWRSVPSQPVDLRAGDSILFMGERNNESGNFEARSILVLPPNS